VKCAPKHDANVFIVFIQRKINFFLFTMPGRRKHFQTLLLSHMARKKGRGGEREGIRFMVRLHHKIMIVDYQIHLPDLRPGSIFIMHSLPIFFHGNFSLQCNVTSD
jgi:hypothetical protein